MYSQVIDSLFLPALLDALGSRVERTLASFGLCSEFSLCFRI